MGQITIKVPQRIKRDYKIADPDLAKNFLSNLENSKGLEEAKLSAAEDVADIRAAEKSLAEFRRTGESYSLDEIRRELGL